MWGRLASETTPEAGTVTYTYTANDQVATTTNARGITTTLAYNNRNLVTGVNFSDPTPASTYTYDNYGARTAMTDGEGTMSYTYNSSRQLQSETRTFTNLTGNNYTLNYNYGLGGQLKQANYVAPNFNKNINYAYKSSGALSGIGTNMTGSDPNTTSNIISSLNYRAFGAVDQIVYGNDRKLVTTYNALNQLSTIDLTRVNGTNKIYGHSFGYNDNGQIYLSYDTIDSFRSWAFTYNFRYQMTQGTSGWNVYTPTIWAGGSFDNWGNKNDGFIFPKIGNSQTPVNNRPSAFDAWGWYVPYTYDQSGNMISAGATTYQWDGANRMKSVNGGNSGSFGYDGNGKRVKKVEGTVTIYSVYSSVIGADVMEVTTAGVQRAYIRNGGSVVAQLNANGNFYWMHVDHLGSGHVMTDTTGALAYRAELDPHGVLLFEWNATPNMTTKKFTGYDRDPISGLDYAQARMYNQFTQRFMSPDPAGLAAANAYSPRSLNRYTYVDGDPVNKVDPSGLLTLLVHGTGAEPMDHEWAEFGSEFWQAVSSTFGEEATPFNWREFSSVFQVTIASGYTGIFSGGQKLANFLNNEYQWKEGEKLNIIAHSHGGNIVNAASSYLTRQIDNLITLGTPQNTDLAVINGGVGAKNHCNVSSATDFIQFAGSSPAQYYGTFRNLALGAYHASWAAYYYWAAITNPGYPFGNSAMAYHMASTHSRLSVQHFALSAAWFMSTKINSFASRNVLLGSESHHDLITPGTWNNRVKGQCGL